MSDPNHIAPPGALHGLFNELQRGLQDLPAADALPPTRPEVPVTREQLAAPANVALSPAALDFVDRLLRTAGLELPQTAPPSVSSPTVVEAQYLVVLADGTVHELPPLDALTIGRRSAGVGSGPVLDSRVSRDHVRVFVQDGRLGVDELGSRNGTWISRDGQLYSIEPGRPLELRAGDVLTTVGDVVLCSIRRVDEANAS